MIAEIPALPGAICYGSTKIEAARKVEALALRIVADRMESSEGLEGSLRDDVAFRSGRPEVP